MPAVHRQGDSGSGHGCYPPRNNIAGSPNVYVNGIAVHRQGDGWSSHGCGNCVPHGGSLASGSSTVYVNNKQCGRIGDPVSCGSIAVQGSNSVFAGG